VHPQFPARRFRPRTPPDFADRESLESLSAADRTFVQQQQQQQHFVVPGKHPESDIKNLLRRATVIVNQNAASRPRSEIAGFFYGVSLPPLLSALAGDGPGTLCTIVTQLQIMPSRCFTNDINLYV